MHSETIELNHPVSHQRWSNQLMQKGWCKMICIPVLIPFFFFLNLLLYNTPARPLWKRVSVSENEASTEHYTGEQEMQDIELPFLTLAARNGKVIRYVMLTNSKYSLISYLHIISILLFWDICRELTFSSNEAKILFFQSQKARKSSI